MESSTFEREKLEKAAGLHWFHWLIVGFSLVLTFFAWHLSRKQVQDAVNLQFERESARVIELVQERMQKYEDGLWAGVAQHHAANYQVTYDAWRKYAHNIRIDLKYPGINGIGVIHYVPPDKMDSYLQSERDKRPNYTVHPTHNEDIYLPITYIEPFKGNEKAVGLDMAHETNRFTAAMKARDAGESQITGPITLVQDAGKTAGFLFYAPMYHGGRYESVEERRQNFYGLVYAAFVVNRLMEGTLRAETRHVTLRITDNNAEIFSEHTTDINDFDPDPLFKKQLELELYGRQWKFDIWSSKAFRAAANNNQPVIILIGGIIIDTMLVLLFILISRANKRALTYANSMTKDLQSTQSVLQESRTELEEKLEDLEHKNRELQEFRSFVVDREEQMMRLKEEINQLSKELGREEPYTMTYTPSNGGSTHRG